MRKGAGVGITPDGYRFCTDEWLVVEHVDLETKRTQRDKLPAKGSRKPNADEQEQDLGSQDDTSDGCPESA